MQRSRRVVRNIGSTLIVQVLSWCVTVFMIPVILRYVGSTGFGRLNVTTAYCSIFSIFYGVASGFVLVRDIAREPNKLPDLVGAALVMRVPAAIFTILVGTLVAFIFNRQLHFDAQMVWLLCIGLTCVFFAQINDILICALRGVEEFPKVNSGMLAEKVTVYAAQILFILTHRQLIWIQCASIVSGTVQLALNLRSLQPYWNGFVIPSKESVKSLFRQSIPFISTTLFMAIYSVSDPIYLHLLASDRIVAWYGTPNKLLGACLALPVAVAGAALPTLSKLYHEDEEKFGRFVGQMVGLMYLAVIPFSSVLIFAPGPILRMLHLPHDFDGAIPPICVSGFTMVIWFISQIVGTALIASDRQLVLSKATAKAALISVPSCLSLVWIFQHVFHNGAIGATVSDAVVEIFMLRSYLAALPRSILHGFSLRQVFGATASAIPIVAPLYFFHFGKLSLLTAIPGLFAYLPLCILLRAVDKGEIMHLVSLIRSKGSTDTGNSTVETLDGGSAAAAGLTAHLATQQLPVDLQLTLELGWFDLIADEQDWRRDGESKSIGSSVHEKTDEAA